MMNMHNFGLFEGRIVSNPVFFPVTSTPSGGTVVVLKLACKRNFASKGSKEPESDFIEFRDYLPGTVRGHGIYDYLDIGDLVKVAFSLRSSVSDKNGEKTYYQTAQVEQIQIAEPRAIREARRDSKETTQKKKSA